MTVALPVTKKQTFATTAEQPLSQEQLTKLIKAWEQNKQAKLQKKESQIQVFTIEICQEKKHQRFFVYYFFLLLCCVVLPNFSSIPPKKSPV